MKGMSIQTKSNKPDVLVIGGGPAGTTFSTFMQRRGLNVTLLEKDRHPKFHIGESLLPMNLPILERLGVLEDVRAIGVPKLGADFTLGNSGLSHETYHFRNALGASPDHAFEVRRSDFDQLLMENCKKAGVQVLEGMRVCKVESLGEGKFRVDATDEEGCTHAWQPGFLVDASGRDTFLARANGWKSRNTKHVSAAVFGHFRGVERRPGEDQGNISLYWFPHGWIWMIPLEADIMSIGAVCYPEYLRSRRQTLDDFLLATLNSLAEARERMQQAVAIMPAQATGNYSYVSRKIFGPGYILLGDAFAFIDPIFSSGVYIAMDSAERGTRVAESWLRGRPWAYRRACRRFERDTRKGIAAFSWFIYRFNSPVMSQFMSKPRNVFKVVQAVISMLAGDVFSNRTVRRRLLVFKTIYSVSWLLHWREANATRKRRLASVRAEAQGNQSP